MAMMLLHQLDGSQQKPIPDWTYEMSCI